MGDGKEVIVEHVYISLYNTDGLIERRISGDEVYEELPNSKEESLKKQAGTIRLAPGFFGAKLGKLLRLDTATTHVYQYEGGRLHADILIFPNEASNQGANFYVKNIYNENGDVQEERTSTPDVNAETIRGFDLNKTIKFVYEYDKQNNWIKKIVYSNGIPRSIYERRYSYY